MYVKYTEISFLGVRFSNYSQMLCVLQVSKTATGGCLELNWELTFEG